MQKVRNLVLPLAAVLGFLFHDFFAQLSIIVPFLIFTMLFLTYLNLHTEDLKIGKFELKMLAFQVIAGLFFYFVFHWTQPLLSQGLLVTIMVPTATAAVVVTGMLGGSISHVTTYTLLCNLVMAILFPIIFSCIGTHADLSFFASVSIIFAKVFPLLVLPLLSALLVKRFLPKLRSWLLTYKNTSFYLWAISLTIVIGRTINEIYNYNTSYHHLIILMGIASLGICVIQFWVGRKIGKSYGDAITGGQTLGQKNTVLAIWLAQIFLNPISSLVPAFYVIWQNLFNSYQIWKKNR